MTCSHYVLADFYFTVYIDDSVYSQLLIKKKIKLNGG